MRSPTHIESISDGNHAVKRRSPARSAVGTPRSLLGRFARSRSAARRSLAQISESQAVRAVILGVEGRLYWGLAWALIASKPFADGLGHECLERGPDLDAVELHRAAQRRWKSHRERYPRHFLASCHPGTGLSRRTHGHSTPSLHSPTCRWRGSADTLRDGIARRRRAGRRRTPHRFLVRPSLRTSCPRPCGAGTDHGQCKHDGDNLKQPRVTRRVHRSPPAGQSYRVSRRAE